METPTLKEVKEYFKNAETVLTQFGAIVEVENIVLGHFTGSFMNERTGHTLWTGNMGYAKILTTKN